LHTNNYILKLGILSFSKKDFSQLWTTFMVEKK